MAVVPAWVASECLAVTPVDTGVGVPWRDVGPTAWERVSQHGEPSMTLARSTRRLALLAVLTASGAALAGQTLTGTDVSVHYDDYGIWNWSDSEYSLVYTTATGVTQDVTYPGTPWAHLHVEYDQGGVAYEYSANSAYGSDITVVSETDRTDSTTLIAIYEYAAGDLEITKIEYWELGGTVISQQFILHNAGATDLSSVRFQWATDAGVDYDYYSNFSTLNDVDDLDGDGVDDWVVSVGPSSGIAVGFAPCDPDSASLGHSADWDEDADRALSDDNEAEGDHSMNWVHAEGALAAGDTVLASNLVVLADDEATAEGLVSSESDLCDICDADGDGALAGWCGGDDCDDDDATVYPSADETDAAIHPDAQEVCDADDVDEDCDGLSDDFDDGVDESSMSTWFADTDGDGFGDVDNTGLAADPGPGWTPDDTDCDDASADTYPGATEVYDGYDNDCDGVVPVPEQDADADGMSACEGDCDDADPSVFDGATELPDEGIDQDCDGEDAAGSGEGEGEGEVETDTGGLSGEGDGGNSKGGCSTVSSAPPSGLLALVGLVLPLFVQRRRR